MQTSSKFLKHTFNELIEDWSIAQLFKSWLIFDGEKMSTELLCNMAQLTKNNWAQFDDSKIAWSLNSYEFLDIDLPDLSLKLIKEK